MTETHIYEPFAAEQNHKGLDLEEPLIFEIGALDKTGVDSEPIPQIDTRLGDCANPHDIALPGLTEPEAIRHYIRLSRKNHSIDANLYPLGSCTMKHNPRLNEKMARLAGFGDIHPLQPQSTVQGALELMDRLTYWLTVLTNMPSIALSPKAGAHGELCGMMAIRAAIADKGELATRKRVLVPESAHGTNPATAALLGFRVDVIPSDETGCVNPAIFKEKLADDVAALMLTNPNTCGLFERNIIEIADALHEAGGYFYCDGANFNAIVGRVRPGDLGVDAMHINLHKTFSTPHGGGGPGAGPTAFSERLAAYAPLPYIVADEKGWHLVEHESETKNIKDKQSFGRQPFGRMTAFHGQMGMFVRALSYMMSHGADGLRQVADDAVLNANYILASLKTVMSASFDGLCMHEALFDDRFLRGTGIDTFDFAKALIDEGFHPMTMYFPLAVQGAMLIEPTETESRQTLDLFIAAMRALSAAAKAGDKMRFKQAPRFAPRRRLDETQAARQPVLKWTPPTQTAHAAE